MARGRMISKALSTSEKYAKLYDLAGDLAEFCQATYPLLVAHSDDFGRLQGDLHTVKTLIIPGTSRNFPEIQGMLTALHRVGLIQWYCAEDGKNYIQINKFEPHQTGLHKRTASRFPGDSGRFPEFPGDSSTTELKGTEGKGRELKGRELKDRTAPAAPRADDPPSPTTEQDPARTPSVNGNYQVIANIAGRLLEEPNKFEDESACVEAVKGQCARLKIIYTEPPDIVHRAVASEWVKHRLGLRRSELA